MYYRGFSATRSSRNSDDEHVKLILNLLYKNRNLIEPTIACSVFLQPQLFAIIILFLLGQLNISAIFAHAFRGVA